MKTSLSTTGIARRSARRPWLVIASWLLVLVVAGMAASQMRTTTGGSFTNGPDSARAQSLIEQRLRADEPVTETVIVRSEAATVDDPTFQAVVEQTTADLLALDGIVTGAGNYYQALAAGSPLAAGLVSPDRRATLIHVELGTDFDQATENAAAYLEAIAQQQVDGFTVLTVGDTSATEALVTIAEEDMRKAELFGLPIALIVLIVVFGALVAAGVPIIIGVVSIGVAFGLAAGISQVFSLDFAVTNMISMIGLAVGIDYALFIIERFREERRRGVAKDEAIATAGGTASKAVLFSGSTVILALTGMLLIPMTIFKGLAIGAILTVMVAVSAALTLIPALLSLLGDRVNWPRRARRRQGGAAARVNESFPSSSHVGFWGHTIRIVMRRPVISMAIATVLLLAASAPFLELQTGQTGIESLPAGQVKTAFEILREDFHVGLLSPVQIVIDGDATDPKVVAGVDSLLTTIEADARYGAAGVEVNEARDLTLISAPLVSDANAPESFAEIEHLRAELVPRAFAGAPAEVLVGGDTAYMLDFNAMLSTWMPIVFAFVLGLSFILLMVAFRSIVVPVLSILLNLLSVGAAYGLLVLAFQKGYGGFLGFEHTQVVEAWIPVFLFCILFGLSMDYHVFLLSRIREHFDQTGRNDEAVAAGVQTTARIITGAALIMVVVFGAFAAGRMVSLQQVGFGLAVSVFLDATIVRSILVPSAMKLLGNWNWYLPAWLRWLPDFRIEGAAAPRPASISAPVFPGQQQAPIAAPAVPSGD